MRTGAYRGTFWYAFPINPGRVNMITIRPRTWDKRGVRMFNYQLDYLDHNGRRKREAVKDAAAVRNDDEAGKQALKAEAMRQAKQIRQALTVAMTTGDTRMSHATSKSVLQIVDEYLDPEYQREQTNKGRYMRMRLEKFKPSRKPLHAWTRHQGAPCGGHGAKQYRRRYRGGYAGATAAQWPLRGAGQHADSYAARGIEAVQQAERQEPEQRQHAWLPRWEAHPGTRRSHDRLDAACIRLCD